MKKRILNIMLTLVVGATLIGCGLDTAEEIATEVATIEGVTTEEETATVEETTVEEETTEETTTEEVTTEEETKATEKADTTKKKDGSTTTKADTKDTAKNDKTKTVKEEKKPVVEKEPVKEKTPAPTPTPAPAPAPTPAPTPAPPAGCAHPNTISIEPPSTCTTTYTYQTKCADCGQLWDTGVPTPGGDHSWSPTQISNSTCSSMGEIADVCTVCSLKGSGTPIPSLNCSDNNGDALCDTCNDIM